MEVSGIHTEKNELPNNEQCAATEWQTQLNFHRSPIDLFRRLRSEEWWYLLLLLLIILISAAFMLHHLGQFISVDEPKWFETRIPQLLNSLLNRDWAGTMINDKPGLLPAALSLPSFLLFSPTQLSCNNIEEALFLWRLPIVIFSMVTLAIIFLLLYAIFDKYYAILSLSFIALNPILVGASQIVNPDATLWSTSFISFLAFFLYLRTNSRRLLYFSSFFFGLALLSKYFASILYIIFLLAIIIEFLTEKNLNLDHLRARGIDYLMIVGISIATYSLLFPATWVFRDQIFKGTILAKIITPGCPLIILMLFALFFDIFILNGYTIQIIKKYCIVSRILRVTAIVSFVYLVFLTVNLFSYYFFFDFDKFIFNYKMGYSDFTIIDTLNASAYTMLITLNPIVLLSFIFFIIVFSTNKLESFCGKGQEKETTILYTSFSFILLFLLGSSVGGYWALSRYQVLIYPVSAIIAASIIHSFIKRSGAKIKLVMIIVVANIIILAGTSPFYLHYTNPLNIHDSVITEAWGYGGYELAQKLNNLEDAKSITVWTDREGFAEFFIGNTKWRGDANPLSEEDVSYLVLTAGGKRIFNNLLNKRDSPSMLTYYSTFYNDSQINRIMKDYEKRPLFDVYINENKNNYIELIPV